MHYLGQKLSASHKLEHGQDKAWIAGDHSANVIQEHILNFISETVICSHCGDPGTTCHVEGKKKAKATYLACSACGKRSNLDADDRFVKYMSLHPMEHDQSL